MHEKLNVCAEIIGSIFLSAGIYLVPVLLTLSLVLNWNGLLKLIFMIAMLFQFVITIGLVYDAVVEGGI